MQQPYYTEEHDDDSHRYVGPSQDIISRSLKAIDPRKKIKAAANSAMIATMHTLSENTKVGEVDMVPRDIENFEDQYVFDPNATKHKQLILEQAEQQVAGVRDEGTYEIKKWVCFSFCMLCNIVGIFVTLYALGATNMFNSFRRNNTVLYCSLIFYTPTLLWLKMVFLPGKAEAQWRMNVLNRRAWRRKVYYQQRRVFLGRDIEEAEDAQREADERAIREKHARAQGRTSISTGGDSLRKSTIKTEASSKAGSGARPSSGAARSSITMGGPTGGATAPPKLAPILQKEETRRSSVNKRISFQV